MPVWVSWRMDETYIKVKGQWCYLYRAVDKHGQTIDFLLTKERDECAAKRFLTKAIRRHGVPEKITIDGSAANEAAIKSYNEEHGTTIEIRQIKYLHNIVEQDHRGVKRVTRPMLGFKAFGAAQGTLAGIELMHMIKKNSWWLRPGKRASLRPNSSTLSPRNLRHRQGQLPRHDLLSKICDKTVCSPRASRALQLGQLPRVLADDPRSLSTKQAVGLVRLSLPDRGGQAIISFSADDASMTQMRGEQ